MKKKVLALTSLLSAPLCAVLASVTAPALLALLAFFITPVAARWFSVFIHTAIIGSGDFDIGSFMEAGLIF